MSKDKRKILKKNIISALEKENIMLFIIKEVDYSLNYLNYYKLKNIVDNMDLFIEKISKLNKAYYESIKKI